MKQPAPFPAKDEIPEATDLLTEAELFACAPRVPLNGQLGFVIIAHDQPDNVRRLVLRLLEQDAVVALHWDARNLVDLGAELKRDLPPEFSKRFLPSRRVKVEWGLWTVVEATLCGLEALEQSGLPLSHVTLLSGHDYTLRPLSQLREFLERRPLVEHIECVDHEKEKWVTDGLHDERWQYRHFISWRDDPKMFDRIWKFQRSLGWKVRPPRGIKPHFGSQWWTLTWPTLREVLKASRNGTVRGFFRRTWVPDEMFFQTIVASIVPPKRISGFNLNFYHFNKKGLPLVFHADHESFLALQPHFFVRKMAPRASVLRDKLDALARKRESEPPPKPPKRKNLSRFEVFTALQYRALPNRRAFGVQRDLWWGDMECNKRPYTVILAPEDCDVSLICRQFAAHSSTVVYGDIFRQESIDYGNYTSPHPLYPADKPLLRDAKNPNFLFDLIQSHPESRVVFSVRVPSHSDIPHLAVADPHCDLVFVSSQRKFLGENNTDSLLWRAVFDEMMLSDLYWQARKNAKQPLVLSSSGNLTSQHNIEVPPPSVKNQSHIVSSEIKWMRKKIASKYLDMAAELLANEQFGATLDEYPD